MRVRLIHPVTVDDHPRPKGVPWERYHYPESLVNLVVFADGRVVETDTVWDGDASAVVVRHLWEGDDGSSTAMALAAAGYRLEPVV